jgi:hypothetical protein
MLLVLGEVEISGTTMSTPRNSDSGNMRPASMTMMSSAIAEGDAVHAELAESA